MNQDARYHESQESDLNENIQLQDKFENVRQLGESKSKKKIRTDFARLVIYINGGDIFYECFLQARHAVTNFILTKIQ